MQGESLTEQIGSAVGFVAIMALALIGFQALSSTPRGSEAEVKTLLAEMPASTWHFVALQYCYGILNRTYMVFVTRDMICGAKVRGLLAAPVHVTDRWHDPLFYVRPRLVARYGRVNLEGPEFASLNSANFQIRKGEVATVEFTAEPKWGMGTVPYPGRLYLTTADGIRRELILLGNQDGQAIRERLLTNGFGRIHSETVLLP